MSNDNSQIPAPVQQLVGRILIWTISVTALIGYFGFALAYFNAPSWLGYLCGAPIWFYGKYVWNSLCPSNAGDTRAGQPPNNENQHVDTRSC